jgi:hypothetical protein
MAAPGSSIVHLIRCLTILKVKNCHEPLRHVEKDTTSSSQGNPICTRPNVWMGTILQYFSRPIFFGEVFHQDFWYIFYAPD